LLRINNPSGHQVVDIWAFPIADVPVWMSMAQTRSKLQRLVPIINDTFVDTHRKSVLTLVEDTSPGVHDMIFPPCDNWRYAEANAIGHESCATNLRRVLSTALPVLKQDGYQISSLITLESTMNAWGWTPEPLNLFMNVPVGLMSGGGKGPLRVAKPVGHAGDYVVLRLMCAV
jgi:uncharacterized protein YcgI (DUF1989 family)